MNRWNSSGFTLIELMVVIAIIGVITMLAVPNLRGESDRYRLEVNAKKIASVLRYAQTRAVSDGKVWRVNFDTASVPAKIRAYPKSTGATAPEAMVAGLEGVEVTTAPVVDFQASGIPAAQAEIVIRTKNAASVKISVNSIGLVRIE